jgi:hypothetical protein
MELILSNAPSGYYELWGEDESVQLWHKMERPNFIHLFARTEREFLADMRSVQSSLS